MKRKNKWIIIVSLICGFVFFTYLVHTSLHIIDMIQSLDRMEARRPILLYETNHRELLEACRELSRKVDAGQLKPDCYDLTFKQINTDQFPQTILDLHPLKVDIRKDGCVDIIMSVKVQYGVLAVHDGYNEDNKEYYIQLFDGLWYYDEDFVQHPEHKNEIEELLKGGLTCEVQHAQYGSC